MSTETNTNTAIAQFQQLPALAANASAILAKNQNFLAMAEKKAQGYLDTIEGDGMTAELDAEVNKFLVKLSDAQTQCNERRKPITQLFTIITKEYTSIENRLDKKTPDSLGFKLQEKRNEWVRAEAAKKRAQELEIQKQRAIDQERLDIKVRIEQSIREKYSNTLFAFKKSANDLFNTITLENIADVTSKIKATRQNYPRDKFDEMPIVVTSNYLNASEFPVLIKSVRDSLFDELSANFQENMESTKMNLLDQIPARKFELEEIASAGKAERERMEREAETRKQQQELDLQKEQQEKARKDAAAAELTKNAGEAVINFNTDNQLAQVANTEAKTKEGYIINVMSAVGWQQVAAFWFAKLSAGVTLDQLEKKTLGSMKKACEAHAKATGEKIVESAHLNYELDIKAVNSRN